MLLSFVWFGTVSSIFRPEINWFGDWKGPGAPCSALRWWRVLDHDGSAQIWWRCWLLHCKAPEVPGILSGTSPRSRDNLVKKQSNAWLHTDLDTVPSLSMLQQCYLWSPKVHSRLRRWQRSPQTIADFAVGQPRAPVDCVKMKVPSCISFIHHPPTVFRNCWQKAPDQRLISKHSHDRHQCAQTIQRHNPGARRSVADRVSGRLTIRMSHSHPFSLFPLPSSAAALLNPVSSCMHLYAASTVIAYSFYQKTYTQAFQHLLLFCPLWASIRAGNFTFSAQK